MSLPCAMLAGASGLRTSSEFTRPAVVRRLAAGSFAASSTSSSMSKVVHMGLVIERQTSDGKDPA